MGSKYNIFRLSDLNQDFWNKVLFIEIEHSSGLGGSGITRLITEEKKIYVIGVADLPFSEWKLENLNPLFERQRIKLPDRFSIYKAETMGFKLFQKGYALIKEEYFEAYEKTWQKTYDLDICNINYVDACDVMKCVLGVKELEIFYLEETAKRFETERQQTKRLHEVSKKRKLTEDYLEWKPIYFNNHYERCSGKRGIYCLLLKEMDGYVNGTRISIMYQFEEKEPFCRSMNAPIEQYILFKKDYGIIDGKLSFDDPYTTGEKTSKYYCLWDTLDNADLNHPGDFVRSFRTLDEAKAYAIEVANLARYNKDNIIDVKNSNLIRKYEYESLKMKYITILEFGKYYKDIMEIVAEYEFPDENSGGGWYICNELVEKLRIEKEIAKRMLTYIPQILLPRNQRESKKLLGLCEEKYRRD